MKREITIVKSEGFEPAVYNINETVDMWLRTCPNGEWVLKLEKPKNTRSNSQNALLWVWMEVMSKEWAEATDDHYTKEQWKEFFARKFIPVTGPDGQTVGGSTSGLTPEQMTEFLNKIQAYAATEWGITLLGAEDKMFNEWKEQYE